MKTAISLIILLFANLTIAKISYLHCTTNSRNEGVTTETIENYCSKFISNKDNGRYREFKVNKNWTFFAKTDAKNLEWKLISFGEIFVSQKLKLHKDEEFTVKTQNFAISCVLNSNRCQNFSLIKNFSSSSHKIEKPLFNRTLESRNK
jgi:hypothetical protein